MQHAQETRGPAPLGWAGSAARTFGLGALLLMASVLGACDTTRPTSSGGSLVSADDGRERWTIKAFESSEPNHAQQATTLGELLKKVQGLRPESVRVVSGAESSAVYYGEYVKVGSPDSGRLVFPPEYQRDFDFIRRLTDGRSAPFKYAEPQVLQSAEKSRGELDVSNAKGAYTLQIAVFYNTPEFSEREEAAREYVRLLREAGYSAYLRHEALRSYVFVGDFEATDVEQTPQGSRFGPRVEEFIRRNEAEFRHMTENGQIIKRVGPGGDGTAPPSYLVPVPKEK